jgi:lipoate-protein ligase A
VSFRLVIHPKMDGRLAMAIDEILMVGAGEGKVPQTIRLYGFSSPTLSVGMFQPVREVLDAEALRADAVVLVRRPTGGHAVLHDDELTYSVAFSKKDLEKSIGSYRKRAVYDYVASLLTAGLKELGIAALVNARQVGDPRNPDCFASSGEYEITDGAGRKLVGSAQVTTRSAVLQQGSIPICAAGSRVLRYLPHGVAAPGGREPTSLSEAAGRSIGFEEAREAFAKAFRARFGAEEAPLSGAEESAARDLAARKYGMDAWNVRA